MTGIAPKIDPWEQLTKIAREIQPDLPADLSRYEVRIILNKDFQAVELVALDFIDRTSVATTSVQINGVDCRLDASRAVQN